MLKGRPFPFWSGCRAVSRARSMARQHVAVARQSASLAGFSVLPGTTCTWDEEPGTTTPRASAATAIVRRRRPAGGQQSGGGLTHYVRRGNPESKFHTCIGDQHEMRRWRVSFGGQWPKGAGTR